MSCEYLKRDATICGEAGYNGSRVCYYHRNAIPYAFCETNCGRVVSTKHGRPRCCKCAPNEATRDGRRRRKNTKIESLQEEETPLPTPLAAPIISDKEMEDAMIDYVINVILPGRLV